MSRPHAHRDRVLFYGALALRIESSFFRRHRVAVVRTGATGFAGHYFLIFDSEAKADRLRRKRFIVAAAYPFLYKGVRIYFFTQMSAYFKDLGVRDIEPGQQCLAVDLQSAATKAPHPTRIFIRPESPREFDTLCSVFQHCCLIEYNSHSQQMKATRDFLLRVPYISGPQQTGTKFRDDDANNSQTPDACISTDGLLKGRSLGAVYEPVGHGAFKNRYFCIETGIPTLRRRLRCSELWTEGMVHAALCLITFVLLLIEVNTFVDDRSRMQSWVMSRLPSVDEAVNGFEVWNAFAGEFAALVALMDATASGGTDYSADSYALIGGANPISVTKSISASSPLCGGVVDATLDTFLNDGATVYSWSTFESITTNFGLVTGDRWRRHGSRGSTCGVQIRFWSRNASLIVDDVIATAQQWGDTFNDTVNLVITYPLFNRNSAKAMQCSTKYDVAASTNMLSGTSGCSGFTSGIDFLSTTRIAESARTITSTLVFVYHGGFSIWWFWFLCRGIRPRHFGWFFLAIQCLVAVLAAMSAIVEVMLRNSVSTTAMVAAVNSSLFLDFQDSVTLTQLVVTMRLVGFFFLVGIYSLKFLSGSKLLFLIPGVWLEEGRQAFLALSPMYLLVFTIATPILLVYGSDLLLVDMVLQLVTSQLWRFAENEADDRKHAYSFYAGQVVASIARSIAGYIIAMSLLGVVVVGVQKFFERHDLLISLDMSKENSATLWWNPLSPAQGATSKQYRRAIKQRENSILSPLVRRILQEFVDDLEAQRPHSQPLYLSFEAIRKRVRHTATLRVPLIGRFDGDQGLEKHRKGSSAWLLRYIPQSLRFRIPAHTTPEYLDSLVDFVSEMILLTDSDNLSFLPLCDRLLVQAAETDTQNIAAKALIEAVSPLQSYYRYFAKRQVECDNDDPHAFMRQWLNLPAETSDISLGNLYVNSTLRLLTLRPQLSLVNDYSRKFWQLVVEQLRQFEESQIDFFNRASVLSTRMQIFNQKYSATHRDAVGVNIVDGGHGIDNLSLSEYEAQSFGVRAQGMRLRAALAARDIEHEEQLISQLEELPASEIVTGEMSQQVDEAGDNRSASERGLTSRDAKEQASAALSLRDDGDNEGLESDPSRPSVLPDFVSNMPGDLEQNWEALQYYLERRDSASTINRGHPQRDHKKQV